jgi:aldehyde:ferredoxin oxidoreductase
MSPRGGDYFRVRYCSFDSLGGTAESGHTGMSSPDSWEAKTALSIVKAALANEGRSEENPPIGHLDYTARGALCALSQKLINVSDMLGQCRWNTIFVNAGIGIELQSRMLSAGEGRERSIDELMEIASRLAAQERAFAVREGVTREQDTLPKRLFNHKMPGYFPKDSLDPMKFEEMKDEYYEAMGWDVKTGIPTRETLISLKLGNVASDLEKRGRLPEEAPSKSLQKQHLGKQKSKGSKVKVK